MKQLIALFLLSLSASVFAQADSTSGPLQIPNYFNSIQQVSAPIHPTVSYADLNIATRTELQQALGSQCPNCTCPNGTTQVMSGYYVYRTTNNCANVSAPMGSICTPTGATSYVIYAPQYTTVCKAQ